MIWHILFGVLCTITAAATVALGMACAGADDEGRAGAFYGALWMALVWFTWAFWEAITL